MQILGVGVHLLVALFFAIHAVRRGQNTYWLLILFSFPLLGSAVYFFAVYLPESRLDHTAYRAVALATKVLNPRRELKEARKEFDDMPTTQNQLRLADALLNAGLAEPAAIHYEACLKGLYASDPEILFGAAQAHQANRNFAEAIQYLQRIRAQAPDFRAGQISLHLARALAGADRQQEAKSEFEYALAKFGSFESKAEYFIWAVKTGDKATAEHLQADIQKSTEHWSRSTRDLNKPLLRHLNLAYAAAKKLP